MGSYLRPRRGKKATATSQGIVLKRGEVFFECPDTGVGTGKGKIKVGDGSSAYASLPYFMEDTDVGNSTVAFTDSSTATDKSNNATYLTNIKPANSLITLLTNLKQLLVNYNSQLTALNNDIVGVSGTFTTYTLLAANWTAGKQYNLTSTYPAATYDLIIGPDSSITDEQYSAALAAMMVCNASTNVITALGDVPTVNIPVCIFAKTKKTS